MKKTLELFPPRIGQVWQNAQRNSTCIFVITKIWEKHYPAKGNKPDAYRTRVTGLLTSGENCVQPDRDIDLDSLGSMFPYLRWNPPLTSEELDDSKTPQ